MKYILNNDNLEVVGKQYLNGVGNYTGDTTNALDLATVINDMPIVKGDAENSAVLDGEYDGYSNKAISQTSMAIGGASNAGLKGWYYSGIDFTNNKIYLSRTQPNSIKTSGFTTDTSITLNDIQGPEEGLIIKKRTQYIAGDSISIVCDAKYENKCKITSVEPGIITVDKVPFTSDVLPSYTLGIGKQPDDFTLYSIMPEVNSTTKQLTVRNWKQGGIDLGAASFAEGANTYSTNIASHAEGIQTVAYGQYSHTEGFGTKAGYASHAEGKSTVASGQGAHAEGQDNISEGNASHTEGRGNYAQSSRGHAEGENNYVGNTDRDKPEATNTSNKGFAAHVEGQANTVIGNSAHAEGLQNKAIGNNSHAEGQNNTSTGSASHSEGRNNYVQSSRGHAEGENNYVGNTDRDKPTATDTSNKGFAAHAEGQANTVIGNSAHAEGLQNKAIGLASHAEGESTIANGQAAHTEGKGTSTGYALDGTTYAGTNSHAEGESTIAARGSHAEGIGSIAYGWQSHAEGKNTVASANFAHTEGEGTKASASRTHAEGYNTKAISQAAHSEGINTIAGKSVDENGNIVKPTVSTTTTEGYYSHAEGNGTLAYGNSSHAEGKGTIAYNIAEHASGQYNLSTKDSDKSQATRFSIGIGTSDTDRKNAFEVKQNGDVYIEGVEGRIQDKIDKLVNITYSELVNLRNNSKLIPGQQYRITDYVTIVGSVWQGTVNMVRSAYHQFDIIVTAADVNILNENARAIQHTNDENDYFHNSNLAAWELKYCLDNDTKRFAWADATNGKGVIYYMKDEWNNECPYDFKNIQFARWELSNPIGYRKNEQGNWIQETTPFNSLKTGLYGTDDTTKIFNYGQNLYKVEYTISESPTYCYTFGNGTDYSISGSNYGNVIKEYKNGNKIQLNNIVFLGNNCSYNSFGNNCSLNSFGNYCYDNSFGNKCSYNDFGNSCYYNSFGNDCDSNSFGMSCSGNSFGISCYHNSFGDFCNYNSFGNYCRSNSFGEDCSSNNLGNDCDSNSFGNYCNYNSFGNSCEFNSFGNSCYYNSFGENCHENSFGTSASEPASYYRYIIFDNGNQYINLKCTSTTSSINYFQNVRICLGVNNTTISTTISNENVGQTYQTLYKPINSIDKEHIIL